MMFTRKLVHAALFFFGMVLLTSSLYAAPAAGGHTEIEGTIVSIRQNILQVRPPLRHRMARIAIGPSTAVVGYRQLNNQELTPGMRVLVEGPASSDGLHPRFVYAADRPIGRLAMKSHGLAEDKESGFVSCTGRLKTVNPFVFTDDVGKPFTAVLDRMWQMRRVFPMSRNALLIGVTVKAFGTTAPDGVIRAQEIVHEGTGNASSPGVMFGKILAVHGGALTVRPRYASDAISIALAPGCLVQKQSPVPPESVTAGSRVTFWVRRLDWSKDLMAVALLTGAARYPAALAGRGRSFFVTGRLESVDPTRLVLSSGRRLTLAIPAQMPIARLQKKSPADIKPGASAMFLIMSSPSGFAAQAVVIDASPWLGYGA